MSDRPDSLEPHLPERESSDLDPAVAPDNPLLHARPGWHAAAEATAAAETTPGAGDTASAPTADTASLPAPAEAPPTVVMPVAARPTSSATASPQPSPRRSGPSWWHTLAAAVLGATLAVGGLQLIDDEPPPATSAPTAQQVVDTTPATAAPEPVTEDTGTPVETIAPAPATDAAAVGAKVLPSIVTVQVGNGTVANGSGSGVIISSDGLIVTNDHVVDVGSQYEVLLADGRTSYDAELIGADPLTDLAVLKIDVTGLVPIEFGATDTLTVGDPAIAVGSPLGLAGGPSLTVGVVSAFGRQVQTGPEDALYGMLQTDAPITQGSSGGALVDATGRLIGITTAVGVSSVGVEGIGFATPVEIVRRVIDELVAEGSVAHAFLGITGGTGFLTADDGARVAAGVEVASVEAGSAAAAAGLVAGDVITAIDGEAVDTMDELIVALRVRAAGDRVTLTVDGEDVVITLGAR